MTALWTVLKFYSQVAYLDFQERILRLYSQLVLMLLHLALWRFVQNQSAIEGSNKIESPLKVLFMGGGVNFCFLVALISDFTVFWFNISLNYYLSRKYKIKYEITKFFLFI